MADRFDVVDPATATARICAGRCTTCIYRRRTLLALRPGRLAQLTRDAIAAESHIVCHETVGTDAPAVCAGYARLPRAADRSLVLRLVATGDLIPELVTPPDPRGPYA